MDTLTFVAILITLLTLLLIVLLSLHVVTVAVDKALCNAQEERDVRRAVCRTECNTKIAIQQIGCVGKSEKTQRILNEGV